MTSAYTFNFDAARSLPAEIRFGTSSWTYPGWQGLVYHQVYKNEQDLKKRCLAEYVNFPWFRTVGIDSAFYSPMSSAVLRRYAEQVPSGFQWASKVWEEITVPKYAPHARYGSKAGKDNSSFLNADKFATEVLAPYSQAGVEEHAGPFIFEFQRFTASSAADPDFFLKKLDAFLSLLPGDFKYAVEIRTPQLLVPDYFAILNRHKTAHCFNHWTAMPALSEQMRAAASSGGLDAPFLVARLLTPRGTTYEGAVRKFAPYDSIKEPQEEMRQDVVRLARRALKTKRTVYLLVNNRLEGSAPQTIDIIGRRIVESIGKPAQTARDSAEKNDVSTEH